VVNTAKADERLSEQDVVVRPGRAKIALFESAPYH
jgi:hypothetical protein